MPTSDCLFDKYKKNIQAFFVCVFSLENKVLKKIYCVLSD